MVSFKKSVSSIIYWLLSVTFRMIPIKQSCIFFTSFNGEQYSCNPKYIFEYLAQNTPFNYQFIWGFLDPQKYQIAVRNVIPDVKIVKLNPITKSYYYMTSRFAIYNSSDPIMPIRKGQIRINTWHGGGCYKRLFHLADNQRSKMPMIHTTHFVSSCKLFSDIELQEEMDFNGIVLQIGLPRNDVFFNPERAINAKIKVHEKYGINNTKDIALYAPTWRDNQKNKFEFPDYERLQKSYQKRFNRELVILVRGHHGLLHSIAGGNSLDATEYPDTQELLLAADMLISDYSSIVWDYSLRKKPCIIYAPDLENYERNHGFWIDIRKWGFPIVQTNDELCKCIEEFNLNNFEQKMTGHAEMFGSYEDGHACEKIAELIIESV